MALILQAGILTLVIFVFGTYTMPRKYICMENKLKRDEMHDRIKSIIPDLDLIKSQSFCGEDGELICYTGCCPADDWLEPEIFCDETVKPVPPVTPVLPNNPANTIAPVLPTAPANTIAPVPPVLPTELTNTIAPDMSTDQSSSTGSKVLKVGEIIGIVCGCIAGVGSALGTIVRFGSTIKGALCPSV